MAASQAPQPAPNAPEVRLSPPTTVLTRAPLNALMRNFMARYRSRGFLMGWQPRSNALGMVQPILRRYLPLENMLGMVSRSYRLRRRRAAYSETEDSGWDAPQDDFYAAPTIQTAPPILARARLFAPPIVQSWQADSETALTTEHRSAYSHVPRTLPNHASRASQTDANPDFAAAPPANQNSPIARQVQTTARANLPLARQTQTAISVTASAQPIEPADNPTLAEKPSRLDELASSPTERTGSAQVGPTPVSSADLTGQTAQLSARFEPGSPRLAPPTPLMQALARQDSEGNGPDLMRQWTGANASLNLPRLTMTIPPIIARATGSANPATAARPSASHEPDVAAADQPALPLTHWVKASDTTQPIQKGQTAATELSQITQMPTRLSSPIISNPTQTMATQFTAPVFKVARLTQPETTATPPSDMPLITSQPDGVGTRPAVSASQSATTLPTGQESFLQNSAPALQRALTRTEPTANNNPGFVIGAWLNPTENFEQTPLTMRLPTSRPAAASTNSPETNALPLSAKPNALQNRAGKTSEIERTAKITGAKPASPNEAGKIADAKAVNALYQTEAKAVADSASGPFSSALARVYQRLVAGEKIAPGNPATMTGNAQAVGNAIAATSNDVSGGQAGNALARAAQRSEVAEVSNAPTSSANVSPARLIYADNYNAPVLMQPKANPATKPATSPAILPVVAAAGPSVTETMVARNSLPNNKPGAGLVENQPHSPIAATDRAARRINQNNEAGQVTSQATPAPESAIHRLPTTSRDATQQVAMPVLPTAFAPTSPAEVVPPPPIERVHPTKAASPADKTESAAVAKRANPPKAIGPLRPNSAPGSESVAPLSPTTIAPNLPMSQLQPTATSHPLNRLAALSSSEAAEPGGQSETAYPPVPMSQPTNVPPHFEPGDFAIAAEAPARPGQPPKVLTIARQAKTGTKTGPTVQRKATAAPLTTSPAEWSPPTEMLRTAVGQPLERQVRENMSQIFGTRFDHVRVHTNPEASRSAAQVGAEAYTVGPNIFFAPGRYQPHRPEGQALIGHELTHVVQQASLPSLGNGRMPETSAHGQQLERQAMQNERLILQHLSQPRPEIAPAPNVISREVVTRTGQAAPSLNLPNTPAPTHLKPTSPTTSNQTTSPIQRVLTDSVSQSGAANSDAPALDYDLIAQKVFRLLKQQLQNDRERTGLRGGFFH